MLGSLGVWIRSLSLFTAVRESALVYPTILSTHLACIAVFGGLILVGNLRLLGLVLRDVPIGQVMAAFRPWKQAGFVIMITLGILLGGAKANEYFGNPYFWIKMTLLVSIAIHGTAFRRSVYRNPALAASRETPRHARLAGVLSIVLWIGVLSMGRWIAYYDRPEPAGAAPRAAEAVLPH